MTLSRFSEAYNEGWNAYEAGDKIDDNPYPEGTHERDGSDSVQHYQWWIGWSDAWEYWNA